MPLIERAKIPQSSLIVTLYCKLYAMATRMTRVWYVLTLVTQEYFDVGRMV
jgi:hypothetical protein